MIEPLIRFLSLRDALGKDEVNALRAIKPIQRNFLRGDDIVPAYATPSDGFLLLDGIAGRECVKADGNRSLTALHFVGEMIHVPAIAPGPVDHAIVALSPLTVAVLPQAELLAVLEAFPHLMRLFWLMTAIDAAIQRAWIGAMGRSTATGKLAHLLCECHLRRRAMGKAQERSYHLPLTYAQLADCLGLSQVQMSRSFRDLRLKRLATFANSKIEILDWDKLCEVADFDDHYLDLAQKPR